ncbi:MAG: hypothetical protein WC759_02675 [Candidatus Micrarchaeia archaeon]|jgi:chromosome segregation ATPase
MSGTRAEALTERLRLLDAEIREAQKRISAIDWAEQKAPSKYNELLKDAGIAYGIMKQTEARIAEVNKAIGETDAKITALEAKLDNYATFGAEKSVIDGTLAKQAGFAKIKDALLNDELASLMADYEPQRVRAEELAKKLEHETERLPRLPAIFEGMRNRQLKQLANLEAVWLEVAIELEASGHTLPKAGKRGVAQQDYGERASA